jgi:hypothetical protein
MITFYTVFRVNPYVQSMRRVKPEVFLSGLNDKFLRWIVRSVEVEQIDSTTSLCILFKIAEP